MGSLEVLAPQAQEVVSVYFNVLAIQALIESSCDSLLGTEIGVVVRMSEKRRFRPRVDLNWMRWACQDTP